MLPCPSNLLFFECIPTLLRIKRRVSHRRSWLPSVGVDIYVDHSISSLCGYLVLCTISWNLVELDLVLVLGCESRNGRELLVLSIYLGRSVEVLRVLALALALIDDGRWSKKVLGQRPSHVHLILYFLGLLLV